MMAKESFRKRSEVIPEARPGAKSALVNLRLVGFLRDGLHHDLEAWIGAFRDRIEAIHRETFQELFENRIEHWSQEVETARKRLDLFRIQNHGADDGSPTLAALEADHRRASDWLRRFRDLQVDSEEKALMVKAVGVRVFDPPVVGPASVVPAAVPRILASAGIGAGIGAFLGLLLEAFRARRLKRKAAREAADRQAAARAVPAGAAG